MILITYPKFSVGYEGDKVQEKIKNINPISDIVPITIKTIQYNDINGIVTETQTITKGMCKKYRYDLAYNKKSMLANLFYESWFVSVGLYDSDPNSQQYGIWVSEDDRKLDKEYYLYILGSKEQYLLCKTTVGIGIKNICEPIDKVVELEKRINSANNAWSGAGYGINVFMWHGISILEDETDKDARKLRIVSFSREKDDGLCVKVESPKSKSIFTFIEDKERTNDIMKFYNRENGTNFTTPLPGMVQWKLKGFTTPPGAKTNKQFRSWFCPGISNEFDHIVAKFISCDGKNVVLEKENGQTVTMELSKLVSGDDQSYIKLFLDAEKTPENKTEPLIKK
jgi:hypothetical protein